MNWEQRVVVEKDKGEVKTREFKRIIHILRLFIVSLRNKISKSAHEDGMRHTNKIHECALFYKATVRKKGRFAVLKSRIL